MSDEVVQRERVRGAGAGAFPAVADCSLDALRTCLALPDPALHHAVGQQAGVPVYDADALDLRNPGQRAALLGEWGEVLEAGAGVLLLRGACADLAALDVATEVYRRLLDEERQRGRAEADHFAAAGNNDRLWNSLQKLAERAPETFARMFASPAIAAVCEAWLGPGYQLTAQLNQVRPGAAGQRPHRDYHLGFMSDAQAARYPSAVHRLCPRLTLQGAIAHVDMPVEAGPTRLLPRSQRYELGYLAWRRGDFGDFFEQRSVQVPLQRGDAVFFNPALFHAAGENRSADIERMANLLQVSSAFGRAMETVDRVTLVSTLYPSLRRMVGEGCLQGLALEAVIAAAAEGYAFPTNLDLDPPVDGLAPRSQQALLREALQTGQSAVDFDLALAAWVDRRRA